MQASARRPNIVFILADDLGYGDVGVYGCPDIRTPEIDRLASQGVRFTHFYASAPECTPTRAALLTGRYPQRVGGLECAIGIGNVGRYDDAIRLRSRNDLGLPAEETSLAQMLKGAGYATAITGKWHLGYEPKFHPHRHGFDYFFGPLGGAVDYFRHTEPEGEHMLYRGDAPVHRKGYLTDLIAAEAVGQIRKRGKGKPLFLYVPFTAPHDPYQGPGGEKPEPARATYAAMVERLDRGVGEIVKALDAEGLAPNTLVLFTSDNGGARFARNAPFSRGKGTTFEGGIRVPCIARWPGVLPAEAAADQVGITMDLTASLARIAGAGPPPKRSFDGMDILQAVENGRPAQARTLFWRLRRGDRTRRAVRDGSLKYICEKDGGKTEEYLFDLERDPAEQTNLLQSRGAEAEKLRAKLADWETAVRPTR
jgi:N-acetylgalactosamine-6-sulfatase